MLWRLTQYLAQGRTGRALAGYGQISLQIYLVQDLAFACLRAILPHIPGAGSENRTVQILLALLITGLLTGAILVLVRATAAPPWLARLLWGKAPTGSGRTGAVPRLASLIPGPRT